MYVAVRAVVLFQAGYARLREGLDALGLDAVELALSRNLSILLPDSGPNDRRFPLADETSLEEARRAYHDAGIHITGLLLANNFNAHDLEAEIRWVAQAVRIAEGLGADAVRLDAAMTGQNTTPFAQRVEIYAKAVARVLAETRGSRIPLAIENHGLQGNDPEWLQSVLDEVGSDRVGLALDTANFYWAGFPLEEVYLLIERFAPYARHVHCKNIRFPPDQREVRRQLGWGYGDYVCPLPDGDLDHFRITRILYGAGYGGGLNIEDESLGKYTEAERQAHLKRGADYLAAAAESVGGSRLYRGPVCGVR